jgi:acetyltransferase-like isoleucine patch superfamily enzyme
VDFNNDIKLPVMDRKKSLINKQSINLYEQIIKLHNELDCAFIDQYSRSLPLNETLLDRWRRAEKLGFGKESSIYDSSLVFGNIKVGKNCWFGPFTIIDGSGGLEIGDFCTISVGVHIYTHDNVKQTLSSGKLPIEREKVVIGNNVYIGPNAIIIKGVSIGSNCIIGANAFVNKDVQDNSIVFGQPAEIKGKIIMDKDKIEFKYLKNGD